ncbi:MAG: hypothetical protein JOY68_05135 [Candidatus Dormibacteraeota bacterium]|nr:hypothetical protein [Candidatus Dormibacteraeota bacterium]
MTPELFNLATAAARARCLIAGIDLGPDELEPRHPAFAGFRRVTYVWEEGLTSYPIGDRVALWIDFVRQRRPRTAHLALDPGPPSVRIDEADGASAWTAADLEGAPLVRGATTVLAHSAGRPVGDASSELRAAAAAAAPHAATAMERDALLRATAILDSPGDGGEVSDVAWPYFVLPESAYRPEARRLLAAAAAAWPLDAARQALAVVVNQGLSSDPRDAGGM